MANRPIKPGSPRRRAEKVQVYLWPQVESDKVILDVYKASQLYHRPQDIFRMALWRGVRSLMESGDLPEGMVSKLDLRRRMRSPTLPLQAFAVPPGFPGLPAPQWPAQQPAPEPEAPAEPLFESEPTRIERKPTLPPADPAPADPMDLLGMLGMDEE